MELLIDPIINDVDVPITDSGNKIDITGAMRESDFIHSLRVFYLEIRTNQQEMIEGDLRKFKEI